MNTVGTWRPLLEHFSDMKEFKPFTESFKLPDCIVKICEE